MMTLLNELLEERKVVELMEEKVACSIYNVDSKSEILFFIDEEIQSELISCGDDDEFSAEEEEDNEYWYRLSYESRMW